MKKFFSTLAALTLLFGGTASAQSPLYITGGGEFANGQWNAATPDEFNYADGVYTYEVADLTQFKISTSCGDWEAFNAGALGCEYGTEPGVAVPLEPGYTANISAPWKGDYKITVAGDLSTITLTTASAPSTEKPILYIRGDFNAWAADSDWALNEVSDNVWKLDLTTAFQYIAVGEAFKIADADWNKYNIGSDGTTFDLDTVYTVYNSGNPANMTLASEFNGVVWLRNNAGDWELTFSNDTGYDPGWAGEQPTPPTPPTPSGEHLYITGGGDFVNGAWNAYAPDEFTFENGQYVYHVDNLTQFKISTAYSEYDDAWDVFNGGALTCDYGDEPGVTVELMPGDANIIAPWKGNYTIIVAADLSAITLTTDTPAPTGDTILYLRGDMNDWGVDEEWAMTKVQDGVWNFTCSDELTIPLGLSFKIADDSWNKYNIGGEGLDIDPETVTEVYNLGNPANLTLATDCAGVIWLRDAGDKWQLAYSLNDKDYVPDWNGDQPTPEEIPLYITGGGDFLNGHWNPENPDRFSYANGVYTYQVSNLDRFKISTSYGDWFDYNSEVLGCYYGEEPDVAVPLVSGYTNDIQTPWVGDYTITVAGDFSTITLTTTTPKPEGTPTLYLRGDMTGWEALESWALTEVEENVWKFTCSDDQLIAKDESFKVGDAYWRDYNIGGGLYDGEDYSAVPVTFDTVIDLVNDALSSTPNLYVEEDFNGVFWLRLADGIWQMALSNDKDYTPDWTTPLPEPEFSIIHNGEYVMPAQKFVVGKDAFVYSADAQRWDGGFQFNVNSIYPVDLTITSSTPALQILIPNQYSGVSDEPPYTFIVTNIRDKEFRVLLGLPLYGEELPAVKETVMCRVETEIGFSYFTIVFDTTEPEPLPDMPLYLRGSMNEWGIEPDWMLSKVGENVWNYSCSEGHIIEKGEMFKIADENWGSYNIGSEYWGNDEYLIDLDTLTPVYCSGDTGNLTLNDSFFGILWLRNNNGDWELILSNDRSFVPDWNITPIEPTEVTLTMFVESGYAVATSAMRGEIVKTTFTAPENWVIASYKYDYEDLHHGTNGRSFTLEEPIYADTTVTVYLNYDGDIEFIDSTTGMVEIGDGITIGVESGEIVVKGCAAGDIISVYNMGAQLVGRHVATDDIVRIGMDKGIYVVRVNNVAAKVAL